MISIILLNWNGKKITEYCLKSIAKQTFKNYEIIVVDNASTDGSLNYLKKKFSKVKFIESKENIGYAGGNNLGVSKAKGNYILILNNDTVLDKNFLQELWKNRKKAEILGVKNYYFDKKNIVWAVGSKVSKLTMKPKLIGNKMKGSQGVDKLKVQQVVGSAMFIHKKVIDKIKFLDESYFAYIEETEWQTRAQRAGFSISWVPSAKLWHRVAYSTGGGRSPLSAYYLVRNRARYILKYAKWNIFAWIFWVVEVKLRIIYGLFKNKEYAKLTWNGARDFFRGKKGKI